MRDLTGVIRLAPGALILLLGASVVLRMVGVAAPGPEQFWPAVPVAGGVSYLRGSWPWLRPRKSVFLGTAALLAGAFLFLYTFRAISQLDNWWPIVPIIAGIAALAEWVSGRSQDIGPLWMGALVFLFGAVALPFSVGAVSEDSGRQFARLWPAVLVVVGTLSLAQVLRRADRD